MNCPFYARSFHRAEFGPPFVLIKTGDSRCALMRVEAACWMREQQLPIDWRECPYARQILAEWTDGA
jgi:hypothetical protein